MTLEVVFTPAELGGGSVGSRTAIVIDVLRSTSTILEALVSGAHAVVPVDSVELAVSKAQEIGRDLAILCGERDGQRIEGFHLGNSPLEFTAENVAGKTLVMTTTNGSRALMVGSTAERCLVGSFLNVSGVARAAAEDGHDVLLICAGREGRFALEDALCAGSIANRIAAARGKRIKANDAARTSMMLARKSEASLVKRLFRTAAGRHLIDIGRLAEIDYCAQIDLRPEVPAMRDRRVILQNG